MTKTGLILIAHGAIPTDFTGKRDESEKLRSWPRTEKNDPYWAGVHKVADQIKNLHPHNPLLVVFNEFCAPTLEQGIQTLIEQHQVNKIVIFSSMIMPGGSHAEKEIPEEVNRMRSKFPNKEFHYIWPYPMENLAHFFSNALTPYL